MQQLDVYDVLHTLDDLAIIERDIYKLRANQKVVTDTCTVVKTHMYFDVYIDCIREYFMFPQDAIKWLQKYCANYK